MKLFICLMALLACLGCDSEYHAKDEWKIVKQTGYENYGFIMQDGTVLFGYKDANEAKAAMEWHRGAARHIDEAIKLQNKKMWEVLNHQP